MLKPFLSASLMLLALVTATPSLSEETLHRLMTLNGHGEIRQAPDTANITIGVTSSAATAAEALAANTEKMKAVMQTLGQANIADKDIQTTDFAINPRLDYGNNTGQPPKTVGYDVTNNVNVTVVEIGNLGSILDKVVQAGSNQINGISFSVKNPQATLDKARELAVADARRKAEIYANAAGFTLGDVVSISEQGAAPLPVPMRAKAMVADSAVPIAAGEQALGMDVSITWEIK